MKKKELSTDSEPKLKKPRKKRKDKRIEKEYYEEVELTDPLTGKKFKQKVKVTRYRSVGDKIVGDKGLPAEEEELEGFEYTWEEEEDD